MKTILFQGDSITDVGRDRKNDLLTGSGYATMVRGWLGCEYPGEYRFINRGIGGNRIVDLYARIREDIINLKPDILSILIGVNDVWSDVEDDKGTSTDKFETIYGMMIEEIREELPQIKIMILGPYVLEGCGVCNDESHPGRWEFMRDGVAEKAAAAKRIAQKYGLVYVPLQKAFDEAVASASVEHWVFEGVHPTSVGHELIKRQWLAGFEAFR